MADERKKAQELMVERVKSGSSVFGGELRTFAEAFPQIAHARVELTVDGRPGGVYNETFLGEYINCRNPLCHGGGFSIGAVLREMTARRQPTRKGGACCRGNESSKGGRRIYRPCSAFFEYAVTIEYRPDPA
jgi:hypothetical protein